MKPTGQLTENDIRPQRLMAAQAALYLSDVRRLLERQNEFVHVPCPACGSWVFEQAFEKYSLSYVTCSSCATMYVNPRPTPEILEAYYATSENYAYWNRFIFPASEKTRRQRVFRPRAKRLAEICRRHSVRTGVLLEVGAGFGTFCEELQRLKLFDRIIAVEPTPDLAETCRGRGLEVMEQPIEQISLEPGSIDVIASFEVIEHLFSPHDFLQFCARLLPAGGLLVLTCPNVMGFDVRVLQASSSTIDTEHLNYFHPASLSQLLERCGFETIEVATPGKLDAELVRKRILSEEFDVGSQPFLKQVLVDEWERVGASFQRFLANNLLSSHMWIVGRKRDG